MIPLDTPFYLTYCWVIFSALAYSLWRDDMPNAVRGYIIMPGYECTFTNCKFEP